MVFQPAKVGLRKSIKAAHDKYLFCLISFLCDREFSKTFLRGSEIKKSKLQYGITKKLQSTLKVKLQLL